MRFYRLQSVSIYLAWFPWLRSRPHRGSSPILFWGLCPQTPSVPTLPPNSNFATIHLYCCIYNPVCMYCMCVPQLSSFRPTDVYDNDNDDNNNNDPMKANFRSGRKSPEHHWALFCYSERTLSQVSRLYLLSRMFAPRTKSSLVTGDQQQLSTWHISSYDASWWTDDSCRHLSS